MPSSILDCRVLLGWMQQENAVRFLLNECRHEPELSPAEAEDLWRMYKSRVDELPAARCSPPETVPLRSEDWKASRQFRNRNRDTRDVIDFARVDPLTLQVHQLYVTTDTGGEFDERLEQDGWNQAAFLNSQTPQPIRWRVEESEIVFELPHGEFILTGPLLPDARMQIQPLPSYVSLGKFEGRMILANGYHRTFTWVNRYRKTVAGDSGINNSLLFPVRGSIEFGFEQNRAFILSERAPLFADFFDERMFLPVRIRAKKRYEMRVHVEMAPVYEGESRVSHASS